MPLFLIGLTDRRADVAASWACILAFDTLAFVLTLRRTLAVHRVLRVRQGLFWLMMRDGKFIRSSRYARSQTLTAR